MVMAWAGVSVADNPFTPTLNAQRRAAGALEPAALEPPRPARPKATTVLKVRFQADPESRVGLLRWQDKARAQLAAVNQFLEPAFGVRLEAQEFKRWDRRAESSNLEKILEELERVDPGAGVDWVIGLVTPLPLVAADIHQIGMGRVFGRHIVLRGMASASEHQALAQSFDQMDAEEREGLYARRRGHKEIVVFLHELFHTLGAIHGSDRQEIMNPSYSHHVRTLSPANAELVSLSLGARLAERTGQPADYAPLLSFLERTTAPEWFSGERDELIASLRGSAPARRREASGGDDKAAYDKAVALLSQGKPAESWAALAPVAARNGDDPAIARLACRLSHLPSGPGEASCVRAKELAPRSPDPWLDSAQARILAGKREAAWADLEEAARRAGQAPDTWAALAHLRAQVGALTRAAEALARAQGSAEGPQARALIERQRLVLGFGPGGSGVPPDDEPVLAERLRKTMEAVGRGRRREARAAVDQLMKDYPKAPAALVLACEQDLREGRARQAERRCTQALAAEERLPRAHYLLGHLRAETGKREAALAAFRRAIELDPKDEGAWHALADLFRIAGRRDDLAALKTEYEKTFAKPMP